MFRNNLTLGLTGSLMMGYKGKRTSDDVEAVISGCDVNSATYLLLSAVLTLPRES